MKIFFTLEWSISFATLKACIKCRSWNSGETTNPKTPLFQLILYVSYSFTRKVELSLVLAFVHLLRVLLR